MVKPLISDDGDRCFVMVMIHDGHGWWLFDGGLEWWLMMSFTKQSFSAEIDGVQGGVEPLKQLISERQLITV